MSTASALYPHPTTAAGLLPLDVHPRYSPQMPIVAGKVVAGMPVVATDGLAGTLAEVRAGGHATSSPYLLVRRSRLLGLFSSTRLVPAALVTVVERGQILVAATRAEVDAHPELRPDRAIADDVSRTLQRAVASRAGRRAVKFHVADGVVGLYGHVPAQSVAQRIEALVRTIPGVLAVHTHIDDDESLEYRVAQTLADDPLTRRTGLHVSSRFGHVHLSGEARSFPAVDRAAELAASVQGVARTSSAIRAEPRVPAASARQPLDA